MFTIATTFRLEYVNMASMIPPAGFVTSSDLVRRGDIVSIHHLCSEGEVVEAAGGNYTQLSITGGVVAVHIEWTCNLDWDFQRYCLPK